jgi:hypothetical protein
VYPPSKFFAALVNKNAIKHQKGVPFPQNLAKTSGTLPLDFQTVCIYALITPNADNDTMSNLP